MEIKPRRMLSTEAKRILLGHAKMSVEEITEAFHGVFNELLRLCGGLPLGLAVMGRGLLELSLDAGCMNLEVWERYLSMVKRGEKLVFGEIDDYENLWTTLNVALTVLEERRRQYNGSDRGLCWREMQRSFCVMKKQSIVSFRVLAGMWGVENKDEALFIVKGFSGVGLAEIVMGSGGRSGVRLHDLVHDFSVAYAKKEKEVSKWHQRVLEGYIREEDREGGVREWWNAEDDGYIYENVCRHLRYGGNVNELIELLLNAKWTWVRLKHGGLVTCMGDFEEVTEGIIASGKYGRDEKKELKEGLLLVRDAVAEGWPFLSENRREFGFQVYGRLWGTKTSTVLKFLESVEAGHVRPWAKGIGRWWAQPGRSGRRGEFVLSGEVRAIALHDERNLAVAGVGNLVVFIDLEGMEVVRTSSGHEWVVTCVAFSSDGSHAYSWSNDGALREWHVETGEEVRCVRLKNMGGNESDSLKFECAAIGPQSNIVVTASREGTVEVWDMESGERTCKAMGGFKGGVECVSVNRDGRRILAGGEDGTLRVWDVSTSAQVGVVMRGHEDDVKCAAFSADGQFMASGSDDCTIRVWNVESGTQCSGPLLGHESSVQCICFSEDGRHIISGDDDEIVRIWDAATGAKVCALLGHTDWVRCVSITRDGRHIASGGFDKTVRVWDIATMTGDTEERSEKEVSVECLDVSADGQRFISGSQNGTVRVYDGSDGKQVGDTLHAHDGRVLCVAVSPCGRRFVSGSDDRTLRVWNLDTHAQIGGPLLGHTSWVTCVAYSPNGQFIVSGSWVGTVRVWSTATHAQIGAPIGGGLEVNPMWLLWLAGAAGEEQGRSSDSNATSDEHSRNESVTEHTSYLTCVRVTEDGRRIVCGLANGELYLWDMFSGDLVGARHSQHYHYCYGKILRLDLLEGNVVRSVDKYGNELKWRLDSEEGLVPLASVSVHDGLLEGTEETDRQDAQNEVVCLGRTVRVRGSNMTLATLPASVKGQLWCYSTVCGVVGIVLQDGRLLFLQVKQ